MRNGSRLAAVSGLAMCVISLSSFGAEPQPSSVMRSSLDSLAGFRAGDGVRAVGAVNEWPEKHPSRVLVRFEPFLDRAAENDAFVKAGVREVAEELPLVPGLKVVRTIGDNAEQAIEILKATPGVIYAEPDTLMIAEAQSIPYGITMIGATSVWPTWGQGGAKVCVLDTGVDTSHIDLAGPVQSMSFVDSPVEAVEDYNTHGTHVSGTILALDNTEGVVGVAPQCQLLTGKVLANSGSGFSSWGMSGINWAVANGAKAINMSLSGSTFSQAYSDTVQAAVNAGTLVCCAMGNQSSGTPRYPAAYPASMAVSAVDSSGAFASFSNFGSHCSVAAPGVSVQSSVPIVTWSAQWLSADHEALPLTGSVIRAVTAQVVYCGFGENAAAFPAGVSGKIAHVRRGSPDASSVSFNTKATNALNAGAIGVIISNNTTGSLNGTLNVSSTFAIPVVGCLQTDGDNLLANNGTTVNLYQFNNGHTYASFNGTSMATPHVAGAAGLLLGNFIPSGGRPPVPPSTTRWVLEQTATDAGTPGKDDNFGWGIINVRKAAEYLHGRIRCPGDLFYDNFVDDTDFVAFASAYNDLIAPGGAYTGGDFNGDGQTDDSDFVIFVASYNDLLCP